MQYLLLIYQDESTMPGPEEMAAEMPKWFSYNEWLQERKMMLGGDALMPTATATTVRVRDGERLVSDGPFAETKEQLGGYYLIEAENLDQALDAAARIPSVGVGSVEVRPVVDFSAHQ